MRRNLLTNPEKPRPAVAKVGAKGLWWMFSFFLLFLVNYSGFTQTDVSYTGMTSVTCPALPTATISPSVSGLTFSQISRGSGVTCSSAASGISGSGFNVTLASAISGSKWYTFDISSDASTSFTLSKIVVYSQVSSATGSPNVSIQYSIDGGAKSVIGSFTPTTTSTAYTFTLGTPISVSASQTLNIFVIPNNLTASGTTCRVNNSTYVTVTATSGCTPPSDPTGTITPAANPACGSTTLTYSGASANIYWQTSATGTSTTYPTTSAYTVSSSGTYYVRAYNGTCWSTNSLASAAITINTAPAITTQPSNQTVTEPATATFSVVATNAASYQWQLSTDGGSTWSNISGATSASYTTGATSTSMSGYQYQCIVSGSAPCASVTSSAATLTVNASGGGGGCATNLIISEYVEGSNSNKYIEIYNGTGASVDLSDYKLQLYANGASSPTNDVTLSGTLADGAVIVYQNSSATLYSGINNTAVNFNGDDAVALYKISTSSFVDIFGRIGEDPGTAWTSGSYSTLDKTLVRNADVVAGVTSNPASGFPTLATEWTLYNIDDVSHLGSHTMSCGPMLFVTPATLSGFNYNVGAGPSASQTYALSGTNLTGFPDNITVTAPTDYEISLDGVTYSTSLSVPYTSATLSATTIYVRLIAGLAAGTYNNEIIENAGGGATTTADVTCNGTVNGPTITVSTTFLSAFTYVFGSGPSSSQTYTVSGSALTPAAGNITLTSPADYEISLNGTTWFTSLTLPYASSTLAATTIYVRLIAGLAIGAYNSEILSNAGGGASTQNVTLSGTVTDPSASPTVFAPGDIAVMAVNSNLTCLSGYTDGDDEISFVTFKDINAGTTLDMTDNGWERCSADHWGNAEGFLRISRTGAAIPAGTVVTIRMLQAAPYFEGVYPDNGWSVDAHVGPLILNSNGDQIYFMQGGTWDNGTTGNNDATYTGGTYLFAFNTNDSWTAGICSAANSTSGTGRSQNSGLLLGMECFSMMPGAATDFIKYTGPMTLTSKRGWIDRINSPSNWTALTLSTTTLSCDNYYATAPDYTAGWTIPIDAAGFSAGIWTGDADINWFNCANWQDLTVPDKTINVVIPNPALGAFEPTISDPPTIPVVYIGAECNDIDVQTGRTLTMNHANSRLDVYGNMINNGAFSFTNGIVNFMEDNSTLSGTGNMDFYKLGMVKTTALNTLTISKDINISNSLLFTSGIITTGSFRVNVTNSATAAISGHVIPGSSAFTGFINGNLRRNVAATGSYDFPVGSVTQYEYANINLISSSSLSYIDASFTTPHTTTIDITPLSLYIGSSMLDELLNYGFWTITPNAGTYNYDVTLTERGHTNQGSSASSHTVIKRPNAASNWVLEGTHNNATQSMGTSWNWVTAKRTALSVFSDFAIAKNNEGPLPVELIDYDAYLSNGNGFLSWSTASETNCRMFVVERSVNDMNEFVTVATIAGNGNSNMINKYLVEDKNVQPGINYYRLVQYDYDGTRNELGVRYLVMSNEDEPISIATISNDGNSVYADVINIRNGSFEVQILDASGKLVYSAISQSGDDAYRIKVYNLPSGGVYMMRVSDGISADVKKFMIF